MRLSPRAVSYWIAAAVLVAVAKLNLGPTVLAGLFAFTILDQTQKRLASRLPDLAARWIALLAFLVIGTATFWMVGHFLRQSLDTIPGILGLALPRLQSVAGHYGYDLPFENVNDIRKLLVETLKDNVHNITWTGGLLTKGFFHIVIGIAVAVFAFMSPGAEEDGNTLYHALRRELRARSGGFMAGFEKVLGAQIVISAINTTFTAAFLLFMGFPHLAFLVPATFLLGILPIVGNLCSNTVIVGTGLTLSLRHAAGAMAFLVVVHKLEYFLNSRIVGESIKIPMWQTLLAILIGEVVLGVPGIIIAPAIVHYLRDELKSIPA